MEVFDDLHIVRGDNEHGVAQGLHESALKSAQADCDCAGLLGNLKPFQYVGRVPTAADGKSHILGLNQAAKLLRENVFISGIIGPSREHWDIVGKCYRAETFASSALYAGTLGQVASKVRGEPGAASIAEKKCGLPFLVCAIKTTRNQV